ncbi:hypothetical protein SKAU_G00344350 [Synaphobranchus kaupii]|uniref:Ig-like domain-containing protein n=1 Tax=Synaphobranchus kaupii TaxID=118154 RepID=A0A9Q1EJ87_SYNKA|nr:hypothetical protein SKAU_G00344350 [Synaphobranchus kaupii]
MVRSKLLMSIQPRGQRAAPNKKLNSAALNTPTSQDHLRRLLAENLDKIPEEPADWPALRQAIHSAASEALGQTRKRHQDWFDCNSAKIQSLLKTKHEAHKALLSCPGSPTLKAAFAAARTATPDYGGRLYFYTAVTAGTDIPEFTAVGMVDDEQFMYYDSNTRRAIPKTDWIKENEGADYWDRESQKHIGEQQWFRNNTSIIMKRFNQNQGVHTLQKRFGCDWDDETGVTRGFEQFGYDGEDFITYDLKNQRYTEAVKQGFQIRLHWNHMTDMLEYRKQYLTQQCVEDLKKYVRSTLERKVAPEVSLLQKNSSSPVTCHVTGFFPRGVMVTWQRNGEDLDVDVELGGTVPNEDGTFQTKSHLRVKPEDWKSQKYTCTVQHKSLEQDIILSVTEENINKDLKTPNPPLGIIIGCVVGALLLALIAIGGVYVWKKRSSGESH